MTSTRRALVFTVNKEHTSLFFPRRPISVSALPDKTHIHGNRIFFTGMPYKHFIVKTLENTLSALTVSFSVVETRCLQQMFEVSCVCEHLPGDAYPTSLADDSVDNARLLLLQTSLQTRHSMTSLHGAVLEFVDVVDSHPPTRCWMTSQIL